jgi:hypothetical protein
MEKTNISVYGKCKMIWDGESKRKAVLAQVVYKTPVGKAKNGNKKYRSVTRHELQYFVG